MNQINLIGRLTRDIEVRQTTSGKAVGNFTIAVNRQFQRDTTDFIDCTLWNCEKLSPYLVKGKGLGVTGSLYVENYEDKEGNKRKKAFVNVNVVHFLPESKGQSHGSTEPQGEEYAEVPFTEDNLPF